MASGSVLTSRNLPKGPKGSFPKLQETIVDGRLSAPFFRREQLRSLHDTLFQSKGAILDAITKDYHNTRDEAWSELYLCLADIQHFFEEQDPEKELEVEYRIAYGKDATEAQVGASIVVVVPQRHTYLYSVISVVCAAIAAGNCVVVVLEQTVRHLPTLVANILRQSLDVGILEIAASREPEISANVIHVDQVGTISGNHANLLRSPSSSLAVAMVDRTANLDDAADAIITSRKLFGGTSPYAPDLVLVNEFALKDFLRHLLLRLAANLSDCGDGTANTSFHDRDREVKRDYLTKKGDGCRVITSGSAGTVIQIDERREKPRDNDRLVFPSPLSALQHLEKVTGSTFVIHAYRSLEDALEVANDLQSERLVAAFSFGDLPTNKYLLQFTNAAAGFSNTIPPKLLVGPLAPTATKTTLTPRYSPRLFSLPYPKFSGPSSKLLALSNNSLLGPSEDEVKEIRLEARKPVRHIAGYFERGFFVGAGSAVLPVMVVFGTVVFFGARRLFSNRTVE